MTVISMYVKIRKFFKEMKDSEISVYASQAGFFIILSFFPFVMFLLTLLKYLNISEELIAQFIPSFISENAGEMIINNFNQMMENTSTAVVSVTAVTTLWSASRAALAVIRGLDSVYNIEETRGFIKLRISAIIYTIFFTGILIITFVAIVLGNSALMWLSYKIHFISSVVNTIKSARTVGIFIILTVFFALLFCTAPKKKMKFIPQLPGAVFASSGWIGFSSLYSFYIENMGNFTYIYGSITALVLYMLWLYFCMYIMFVGAEINSQIFVPLYERRLKNVRQKTTDAT